MERRAFLKSTAAAGLLTLITPTSIVNAFSNKPIDLAKGSFANPASTFGPFTWWHWMNGNITKEGITLDLEAMKSVGLGGFQMFEAGSGIPKGPVEYLGDEWLQLISHTISESKRLDLEFAMHNCPGWSSSGGPWITPELAMQQLTWSEKTVNGAEVSYIKLNEPVKRLGFYRDAFVIAFPSLKGEQVSWISQLKTLSSNNGAVDKAILSENGVELAYEIAIEGESQNYLQFEFEDKYTAMSVTLSTSGSGKLTLQYAENGNDYTEIAELRGSGGGGFGSPFSSLTTACFPIVKAGFYRLVFVGSRRFSAIYFSGEDRIPFWLAKGNYEGAGYDYKPLIENITSGQVINPSSIINLTSQLAPDGTLNWSPPAGYWTILRIGHTAIGQQNHSAPTTGTGLDCDKFSVAAFDFHWQHMFKEILPMMKKLGSDKIGLLIDSYEMGLQNWSASFPEEFKKRKSYSIINYLPALTGRVVGSQDETERFLWDFRRVQADVMADNYYGRFGDLCKENGIASYTEPYEGGNFEEMQIGRKLDINMGEFWAGLTMLWPNSSLNRTVKLAASIAHSKGQSIVGAESFTAEPSSGKWQQYPYAMKAAGDWMFTKGLTRIIFHRFAHQPHPSALPGMTMGPWGIHFDRTNTWFKQGHEWIKYLTRCQYVLRQGTFVADLAYYVGEDVPGQTINPEHSKFLPPAGYDFDHVNSDCLLAECKVDNGKLLSANGVSYSVLVLPENRVISLAIVRKLKQFVLEGLILIGMKPFQSAGLIGKEEQKEFDGLLTDIWAVLSASGTRYSSLGKGRVYQTADVKFVMADLGVEPDFVFTSESSDAPINYIHRRDLLTDTYFIANRRRQQENVVCSFRNKTGAPQLWDPVAGAITSLTVYQVKGNRVYIPLTLKPSGSVFIVFKPGRPKKNFLSLENKHFSFLQTSPMPAHPKLVHQNDNGSFTLRLWIKPEIDISLAEEELFGKVRTDHFAQYPSDAEELYGKGHAGSGFTLGRNGIGLYERRDSLIQPVQFIQTPISGWSHLAIVYRNNCPSVYLNGELIEKGKPSVSIVHPSLGMAFQNDNASYYNGELTGLIVDYKVIEQQEIKSSFKSGLPAPAGIAGVELVPGLTGGFVFMKAGNYQALDNFGKNRQVVISHVAEPKEIQRPWRVLFPPGSGAPATIELAALISLHKHTNPGVKYFSGSAVYATEVTIEGDNIADNKKIFLDLGRVEVMAEVTVNRKPFPVLWAPPYRVDITSAVRAGENQVQIKVTNLWPNRLIGDEFLPEENEYTTSTFTGKFARLFSGGIKQLPDWYKNGKPKPIGRTTFTTWRHYSKDSPLLESGLLGPVRLIFGVVHQLS